MRSDCPAYAVAVAEVLSIGEAGHNYSSCALARSSDFKSASELTDSFSHSSNSNSSLTGQFDFRSPRRGDTLASVLHFDSNPTIGAGNTNVCHGASGMA